MAEFNLVGAKTVDDLRELLAGSQLPDPTGLLAWLDKHAQLVEFASLPALGAIACVIKLHPQFGNRLTECKTVLGDSVVEHIPGLLLQAMQTFYRLSSGWEQYVVNKSEAFGVLR